MKTERRMAVSDLEFRDGGDGLTLSGYASTFNQPYDMGWYTETVDAKAFRTTLGRKPDVRLLINHDGLPLARTTSGTLDLETDARGLRVTARLDPADPDVQRLAPKMARGDMNQMSFGFRTISDMWEEDMSKRTLRELDLNNGDVSVVTYPANPNTAVGLRDGENAHAEALMSAMAALTERRAASETVVAVLTRALGHFTSLDALAAAVREQDEDTETATLDAESTTDELGEAARAALARLEQRRRQLRLL